MSQTPDHTLPENSLSTSVDIDEFVLGIKEEPIENSLNDSDIYYENCDEDLNLASDKGHFLSEDNSFDKKTKCENTTLTYFSQIWVRLDIINFDSIEQAR